MDIYGIIRNARNTALRVIETHEQFEVTKTKRNRSSRDLCLQEHLSERENRLLIDAYK